MVTSQESARNGATTNPISPQAFATTQLSLLSAEQAAEISETSLLLSSSPPTVLARAGLALLNLQIVSQRTGLGGKTVIELSLDPAFKSTGKNSSKGSDSSELPEHGLRTGDIVRVAQQPRGGEKKAIQEGLKAKGDEGVVTKVAQVAISIALGRGDDGDSGSFDEVSGGRLWVVKLANDVTYKRMNQTMSRLAKMTESEYTPLMRVLFGLSSPSKPDDSKAKDISFHDPTLNDSQKDAIGFALSSEQIALIHGPPGTGKTYTLIELIRQLLDRGQRVLVCGPSNISVDNIVERLAPFKIPMIRLGHPARLLTSVLNHSLEILTRTSEVAEIVQDIRKEMDSKQSSIRKTRTGRERRAIFSDIKELRKEYRIREGKCVDTLVRGSKVVLATLHGAGGHQLKGQEFDVIVIDEASQALEAQCWIPLSSARKAILAGDHLQLPPTVKSVNSKINAKKNPTQGSLSKDLENLGLNAQERKAAYGISLETTLFDRLISLYGSPIKRLLAVQYRMHSNIMKFPSEELYGSKLIAAPSVRARLLKDLPYPVSETEDTREPLVFIDTQGGDFPEKAENDVDSDKKSTLLGDSKSNEMEAAIVVLHVQSLTDAGVQNEDIAVVTPYNGQLALLSTLLKDRYPGLELGSIDGFQGREKEAVIVSLVRSNPEHEVGFLGERRRLNGMYHALQSISPSVQKVISSRIPAYANTLPGKRRAMRLTTSHVVAMTRPKRHLCVIGDSETVSR